MESSVSQFLTRENGRPRTFGLVVDRRGQHAALPEGERELLCAHANSHPDVCAFGKIAILSDEGISTFQVGDNSQLFPVFCGNSTAAAIALIGADIVEPILVSGMAPAPYQVRAKLVAGAVHQAWSFPDSSPAELMWRGQRVLLLHCLNDYAILVGPNLVDVQPEEIRQELLGQGAAGKLALVIGSPGNAVVEFHNSNGRHGAAPLTGLASIAIAVRHFDWFADYFPGGSINYLADGMPDRAALPKIGTTSSGQSELEMSAIEVGLSPLTRVLAA